jgi:hypothetical protein
VLHYPAGFVDFVDKKIGGVVHVKDNKKIFGCQADTVEHLFAFSAPYRNDHCAPIASGGYEGVLEDILVGPETLTSVNKGLCLSADGHKKYRGRENQPIGFEYLRRQHLVIILDDTGALFVTGIALDAWCDIEVAKTYIFNFRTCGFGTGQCLAQKQIAIGIPAWAC